MSGSVTIAVTLLEYCLSNPLRECRNCKASSGRDKELGYSVGDNKLGTMIRCIIDGGALAILVVMSFRKSFKDDGVMSVGFADNLGMIIEG